MFVVFVVVNLRFGEAESKMGITFHRSALSGRNVGILTQIASLQDSEIPGIIAFYPNHAPAGDFSHSKNLHTALSILAYFFRNADIAREKVQKFIKALPGSINKNAMSTYDMIVEEGVAKGIELGRAEGREEGREETLIQTTREMLLKGFEYHLIMDILHVESEFIDKIREVLLLEQEGLSHETPPQQ